MALAARDFSGHFLLCFCYGGTTALRYPSKKLDSLNIFFFGVLNSSGDGFSITPSAANLKTRYSDIYSIYILGAHAPTCSVSARHAVKFTGAQVLFVAGRPISPPQETAPKLALLKAVPRTMSSTRRQPRHLQNLAQLTLLSKREAWNDRCDASNV